jgi:hypothetical protein
MVGANKRESLSAQAHVIKTRKMISAEKEGERERVTEFRGKKNTPISPLEVC